MNLRDIYKELKQDIKIIEDELYNVLTPDTSELKKASVHLLKAGGKRIRPVLVLLGGKNGTYDIERLKHVAVALELIHMATLVHDDVIDFAETRRGQLTVKAKWDNRVAMFTGDYILARALEYLSAISDSRIHQILSNALVDMCLGEIEQIQELYHWDQSLRTYFLRIKRKTALLMAISCQLGGLTCRVSEQESRALFNYGYHIGMAFQITDDILDFTGTEKQLGKPAGSDLLQGNITLPVLFSFKDPQVKRTIIEEISHQSPNIGKVIELVKQSGGISCAKEIAMKYLNKAKRYVETLSHAKSQDMFFKIANFIESRNF